MYMVFPNPDLCVLSAVGSAMLTWWRGRRTAASTPWNESCATTVKVVRRLRQRWRCTRFLTTPTSWAWLHTPLLIVEARLRPGYSCHISQWVNAFSWHFNSNCEPANWPDFGCCGVFVCTERQPVVGSGEAEGQGELTARKADFADLSWYLLWTQGHSWKRLCTQVIHLYIDIHAAQ